MESKGVNIEVYFSSSDESLLIEDTKLSLPINCTYKDIVAILKKLNSGISDNIYVVLEGYVVSQETTLNHIIHEHNLSLESPLNIEILFDNKKNSPTEHFAPSPVSYLSTNKENIVFGCHDGSFSMINSMNNKQSLLSKLSSKITAINNTGKDEEDLIISTSDGTVYRSIQKDNKSITTEVVALKGSIVNSYINEKSNLLISGLEEGSLYYTGIEAKQNKLDISIDGTYLKTRINKQKYVLDDFIVLDSGFDIFTVLNSRKLALFDLTTNKGNLIRDYLPAKVFSTCIRNNHKNIIGLGLHNGVKFVDINSKRNDYNVIPYADIVTGIEFIDENKYYTSTLKGAVCTSDIRYEGIINKVEIGSDVYKLNILKESVIVLGGDSVYTIPIN